MMWRVLKVKTIVDGLTKLAKFNNRNLIAGDSMNFGERL
jgi:hypothetical protein